MAEEEGGRIKALSVPPLRGLEPQLRAKRLLAARPFKVHSIPRIAILHGQWDGGSIVQAAGVILKKKKTRKRRVKS